MPAELKIPNNLLTLYLNKHLNDGGIWDESDTKNESVEWNPKKAYSRRWYWERNGNVGCEFERGGRSCKIMFVDLGDWPWECGL